MFTLRITLGNDAMRTAADVAAALRAVADNVESYDGPDLEENDDARGTIQDANGNTVGRWSA